MPSRHSLHFGRPSSPRRSCGALHGEADPPKSSLSHVKEVPVSPVKSPIRRTSFNMQAILHPGKDHHNKHSEDNDREEPKNHRIPLTGSLRSSSKHKDNRPKQTPPPTAVGPARFHVVIESPPLVFYGSTSTSTGALLSGRLKVDVTHHSREINLTNLVMTLNAVIATKKPVAKDCPACAKRVDQLNTWDFLSEPKAFQANEDHQFPFSFLLPGHLPATTACSIGSVDYYLDARAKTSHDEEITLTHPIKIERAIPPGPDKASIRVFPPTNLTARFVLPQVIHPIGVFPLQLVLSGVVEKGSEAQTRWRLRKVMWRIEEHTTMISPACPKHGHKVGGDGKALQHVDERLVGGDELKAGWKTDYDTQGGEISLEFDAQLSPSKHPACDMNSSVGLEIKHNFVTEVIIAEEFCPNKNPSLITPTGAARVLRMQFAVILTQRAGMGISWDEEMPPVYTDVPSSPPMYGGNRNDCAFGAATMEDYDGPELEYVDLERIRSDDPHEPPVYRERDPAEYAAIMAAARRDSISGSEATRSRANPGRAGTASPRVNARRSSSYHLLPAPMHRSGLTGDDFEIEPPEHLIRTRRFESDDRQLGPVEDFAVGEAS